MSPHFNSIEEIIADENFLSWYFKTGETKAAAWEEWLVQHAADQQLVAEAVHYLDGVRIKEKEIPAQKAENAWSQIEASLNAPKVIGMRPRRRWWIPASAAAVILLVIGFAYFKPGKGTVLETTYGKIGQYNLPDGSEVILNAHSEVKLANDWNEGQDREIWLKGEAFFKVKKTPRKNKFVVHTNTMDVVVTGTQFNVINREDESSVLLTEGSVTIRTNNGKEIYMKPGDFVRIENNELQKKPVNEEKVLAWRQSKLVFDRTPMSEVASIINRHYGVKVKFADSAIAEKEIGGIMSNDNLDLLIQSLEALGEFKVTKTDEGILVSHP